MTLQILFPVVAVVVGLVLVAWAPRPWVAEGGKAFLWAGAFALLFLLAADEAVLSVHRR